MNNILRPASTLQRAKESRGEGEGNGSADYIQTQDEEDKDKEGDNDNGSYNSGAWSLPLLLLYNNQLGMWDSVSPTIIQLGMWVSVYPCNYYFHATANHHVFSFILYC